MLVLLPPSETKAPGGDGPALAVDGLFAPELNPVREKLVDALVELSADVPASLAALGLSARQTGEVERNAELRRAPTLPALRRYTGVLYDALDVAAFTKAELARANARLAVGSALFGVLAAGDRIPAYRLSGGSVLPAIGPLGSLWRPALEPALAAVHGLVVDLRSGVYANLAKVPGAVAVRVLTEDARGKRTVVSHHNKSHKGRLARALAVSRSEPGTVEAVRKVAVAAGMRVERAGDLALDVIVSG
ncbi:peroxide stress protein YaaA [Crossiella sp. SN42]|uniref:peroxide stress protein YaaA n=1 Tax=Crossiella sp. SN42 TaxID=2944808 RepID=UPI00207D63A8|nr:peroxide stress protein YaaA [Crossiella sp. SN42]MCO1576597.1 peroxide stress protein YaaA [Crossiella sp. SN42]